MEADEEMRKVWAIDIKTMWLMSTKSPLPALFCVCLYNGIMEHSLLFYKPRSSSYQSPPLSYNGKNYPKGMMDQESMQDEETNLIKQIKELFFSILDSGSVIIGFNVILFDLDYIKLFLGRHRNN